MFVLRADKNNLILTQREQMTSGSRNVYSVRFEFSPDWDGLEKTAVFRAGAESRPVLLDGTGECVVPREVLEKHGVKLYAGVYGTLGEDVVLPTIWAVLGTVMEGVPGPDGGLYPPTPELWRQMLDRKGDNLDYDGQMLKLRSGEKVLSEVPITGLGDGGAGDHRGLAHRDAEAQHPVEAIEGLKAALEQIPVPMTADQLRKILMNEGD